MSAVSMRTTSQKKVSKGIEITSQDLKRIEQMARWYAVPIEYLARKELGPEYWSKYSDFAKTDEAKEAYEKTIFNIKRRMRKLRNIDTNLYVGIAPPVSNVKLQSDLPSSNGHRIAWHATKTGCNYLELNWDIRQINPLSVGHAFMAADIALCIEIEGHTVYSEREHTSGITADGELIGRKFRSTYVTTTGAEGYREPDLVIPAPDGKHFIAVEVERKKNRTPKEYANKLRAYRDNENIVAVWYFCDTDRVVQHLRKAPPLAGISKEKGNSEYIRILNAPLNERKFYEFGIKHPALQKDLAKLDSYKPAPKAQPAQKTS